MILALIMTNGVVWLPVCQFKAKIDTACTVTHRCLGYESHTE